MNKDANSEMSGYETLVRVFSMLCLGGAIWAGTYIIPDIGESMYGGAAVFVSMIWMAQVAVLLVIGIAAAVNFSSWRLALSRGGKTLLAMAVGCTLLEGIALLLMSISGAS